MEVSNVPKASVGIHMYLSLEYRLSPRRQEGRDPIQDRPRDLSVDLGQSVNIN